MLTPMSLSQRFHFSRFALATASSSEAETVSPLSLTGRDVVSFFPGDTATAGGLDTSGSSAFSTNVVPDAGANPAAPPTPRRSFEGRDTDRASSPDMGNTRGCRCTGAMTPRQSDPWAVCGKSGQPIFSPASDPPEPMADEINPVFGNNPNLIEDLT